MTARDLYNIIQPMFPGKFLVVRVAAQGTSDYFSMTAYNLNSDGKAKFHEPYAEVVQEYSPNELIAECKKLAEGVHNEVAETEGI